MTAFNDWIASVDPLYWIAALIIFAIAMVGLQLNRIEKQNEGLYDLIRKLTDRSR